MNAIQRTIEIDPSRRVLRLEDPLPETVGIGRVNATLVLDISPEEAERRRHEANIAAWREFMEEIEKLEPLPGDDLPSDLRVPQVRAL